LSWYDESAQEQIFACLGSVYQSRWQAAGQDRSVAEEMSFITERLAVAGSGGLCSPEALRGLDSAIAAYGSVMAHRDRSRSLLTRSDLEALAPMLIKLVREYCSVIVPILLAPPQRQPSGAHLLARTDTASAYIPHFRSWLATFLPVAHLHLLEPRLFDV
jgi:hypothetical protein